MITNERQYRITKAQLEKFRQALSEIRSETSLGRADSNLLRKAETESLQSEIDVLSSQVQDYEALRSGAVPIEMGVDLEQLPSILIRARIARGLTQSQLARRVGLKEQQVQRYESTEYSGASLTRLKEIAAALQLSGTEATELAVKEPEPTTETTLSGIDWTKFPVREMYKRGWFEDYTGSMKAALNEAAQLAQDYISAILDRPLVSLHRKHVRSSTSLDQYALLAWQCRVLSIASKKRTPSSRFNEALDESWLLKLVKESRFEDGPRRAQEKLLDVGVVLVVEPHLPKTQLDGAAMLYGDVRVVGMTLRYDRIDNFWFVLVHELVHVIKHLGRNKIDSIFDDLDTTIEDAIEREADTIAGEVLLPSAAWEEALARYVHSEESVVALAEQLEIGPAIVAGRIRHEADNYVILNELVGHREVRKQFPEVDFGF